MSVTGLSREQFEAVERVVASLPPLVPSGSGPFSDGWAAALSAVVDAIQSQLVVKVEVAPTATATGAIEGLDGLGRRVGNG